MSKKIKIRGWKFFNLNNDLDNHFLDAGCKASDSNVLH